VITPTVYLRYFFEDFDALGAERPEEVLRATDHIDGDG
jgi:cysteinyl-tRNA synthetase